MKIATIICEFNPLHTGHKRLIDYAKSVADKVVCIMSGNFTQRGLPACADKFSRAKHAILAGADMVVELPTVFAVASAENFAFGGINIAQKIGADYLVFGSECGDIAKLKQCLDLIENADIEQKIKKQLASGVSYPKALALACDCELLDKPNNILAIEYLKALRKMNSSILPITLQREDNFNETEPLLYASSAMLRHNKKLRADYSFDFVAKDINDSIEERYCSFVPLALATATKEKLAQTEGIGEGLENRILKADKSCGFEKMIEQIKTKRYTRLRLQRIFLNYILGINKDTAAYLKCNFPHSKILAIGSDTLQLANRVENETDAVTLLADNFYYSLSGIKPPTKLQIISKIS